MSYLVPSEFVTKMVDAGESKIFMSTRDTVIRAYMAGAILALAAWFAVTINVNTGQLLVGALLFPVGFSMLYLLGFDSRRLRPSPHRAESKLVLEMCHRHSCRHHPGIARQSARHSALRREGGASVCPATKESQAGDLAGRKSPGRRDHGRKSTSNSVSAGSNSE
jgi:hypothetical protein